MNMKETPYTAQDPYSERLWRMVYYRMDARTTGAAGQGKNPLFLPDVQD